LNMLSRKTVPHFTRCSVTYREIEAAKLEFLLQFSGSGN
jgi:hypothetical protein